MRRERESLTLYGRTSDAAPLAWSWVQDELTRSGTYWVIARSESHPHPRPVWGVWSDDRLHLSIGSPGLNRSLDAVSEVTVHLDSGVDVVIVEGRVAGRTASPSICHAYDTKYDWDYQVDEYGPLTTIEPSVVLAWRSAGWAGRDGFQATGRWRYR